MSEIMTVKEADVHMTVIHKEWMKSDHRDFVDMQKVWEASKAILHALNHAREVANAQAAEIEELRKLIHDMAEYAGKSDMQEIIQEAESKISELDANELKGLQLMRRVQVVISNPSEIPNSSEFIVTEADQREADRAIADGSAKLQMPETGHGITEVSDAAEGG